MACRTHPPSLLFKNIKDIRFWALVVVYRNKRCRHGGGLATVNTFLPRCEWLVINGRVWNINSNVVVASVGVEFSMRGGCRGPVNGMALERVYDDACFLL